MMFYAFQILPLVVARSNEIPIITIEYTRQILNTTQSQSYVYTSTFFTLYNIMTIRYIRVCDYARLFYLSAGRLNLPSQLWIKFGKMHNYLYKRKPVNLSQ